MGLGLALVGRARRCVSGRSWPWPRRCRARCCRPGCWSPSCSGCWSSAASWRCAAATWSGSTRRATGCGSCAAPACARRRWKDVEDVTAPTVEGQRCVVLRLRDGRTTTIPVDVLAGAADAFVQDLQQHLDRGHGYRPAASRADRLLSPRRADSPVRRRGPVACPGCLEVSPSGLWRPPAKRVEGYPLSRVQIPPPPPDPNGPSGSHAGPASPGAGSPSLVLRSQGRRSTELSRRARQPLLDDDGLGLSDGSSARSRTVPGRRSRRPGTPRSS